MLNNERKLEIYTERLWRLALDLALQSSIGGTDRKGIAVVAEEARNISSRLYRLMGETDSEITGVHIGDALVQLQALMLNGWVEMLMVNKVTSSDNPFTGPIAVLLEEMRSVANDLRGLFGLPEMSADLVQPELKHRSSVTDTRIFLMQMSVGGVAFVENTAYVQEIAVYSEDDQLYGVHDGKFNFRGRQMIPVIDCYARFNLPRPAAVDSAGRKCAVVIKTKWEKEPVTYAVLVDALPLSFGFYACFAEGRNAEPRPELFAPQHVRASWDTADGGQMLFLDWKSLA